MTTQTTTIESNKELVRSFYDLAFNQKKPADAIAKYVGTTYKQHNPTVADGPKAFIDFVTGFVKQFPQLKVNMKRSIAEGDLVFVHSNLVPVPGQRGMAAADVFRVQNGKIVEHWDVLQDVPEKSANTNTMF